MKAFHYLHEQAFGTVECERISKKQVMCTIEGDQYILDVDCREQRALVVFDGEFLYGGLPKNATVLSGVYPLDELQVSSQSVRDSEKHVCCCKPKYNVKTKVNTISIMLYRRFVLLPSCRAVVQKYRNKNLSPVYIFIRVFTNKNGEKVIEWQTTSA